MATSLMHRGLESAAEKLPDHVAVLAGDDRWTYGELNRAANALAQHLAARGVGRGDRVAVMHEGAIAGMLERDALSEASIMHLAVGDTVH